MSSLETGKQFPREEDIERLSKYARARKIVGGKHAEVYERASAVLKDARYAGDLKNLFIAVNIMNVLLNKPADLMVGEPPTYESGLPDNSPEQRALNRIVEENDLRKRIHEAVFGAGVRGDAWWKTYYGVRQDFSEVPAEILAMLNVSKEPIIRAIDASNVFPELSAGSRKQFKAINLAYVAHVDDGGEEVSYLNVERHVPGAIIYKRFRVEDIGVVTPYDVPIPLYRICEEVATGREQDVVPTGVPHMLVHHIPYDTNDEDWQGKSGIEDLESVLAAINDRITQIDYVVTKHSDPPTYGPEIEEGSLSGGHVVLENGDPTPGYMTWEAQLEAAFRELNTLLGLVFLVSETPQWAFGTTITDSNSGGTGTSHTDGGAIKARFFPLLSKVNRVRMNVDVALKDALWTAQLLELHANDGIEGFAKYDATYPAVRWKDGLPRDENAEAEYWNTRTGGKPTADQRTAVKAMDGLDDEKAQEMLDRIKADEAQATPIRSDSDADAYANGEGRYSLTA